MYSALFIQMILYWCVPLKQDLLKNKETNKKNQLPNYFWSFLIAEAAN